jgi:aminoglycoside phosphotransferase (APT) family kinase protein
MAQENTDERAAAMAALARPLFPSTQAISAQRVREGVSTEVYRILAGSTVVYGRVLPEEDAGFAPEALAHATLRARGLRVPAVLYVEHRNPALERAVMITDAIEGEPIGHSADPGPLTNVLAEAGRELALLGQVPVRGWGWIARAELAYAHLVAEHATPSAWLEAEFAAPVGALAGSDALTSGEGQRLGQLFGAHRRFVPGDAPALAHGDYDATHLYHAGGRYAGLIDFGEIRGADPLYDLGHFAVENAALLPALLRGYRGAAPLPADAAPRVAWWRLMIAARRLGRQLMRGAPALHTPDLAAVREELEGSGYGSIASRLGW